MTQETNPTRPEKEIGYFTDGMLRRYLKKCLEKNIPLLIEDKIEKHVKTASYEVTLNEDFKVYKWWPLVKNMRVDQDKYMLKISVKNKAKVATLRNGKGWKNSLSRFVFLVQNGFWFGVDDEGLYILFRPHGFLCGSINEKINLPANIGAILDGKSSTGRRGICVHITAGFADPGYCGRMTTEMVNFAWHWSKFYIGDRVGQLRFFYYAEDCENPYGSENQNNHYQGDESVAGGASLVEI